MLDTAENKKIIRKQTILCKHHVNLSRPLKDNPGSHVFITTLEDKFLVTKYHLGATMIRCILKKKFSSYSIFSKNLYVEIQRYHPSYYIIKKDASQFYRELLSKQREDFDDNMQSCIIAQAFVSNEVAKTYQWLLQMTKKTTNNKCSSVFVTNADLTMKCAKQDIPSARSVITVFPASPLSVEEVESPTSYELSQSKDVDDELDAVILSTKFLMDQLNHSIIKEI
ncbi:22306_t:CDS:2 [Racocetra persica]|uniref:22306_t:CDS:1 n=1 Tax=Racocetra persica TaxID=160502 RepID=A0ACA9N2U5_9GLOM|nr:22306_t:CDS:2 [Racocetra persica]